MDNERGALRIIYTDGFGMATPSMQRDLGSDVWGLVGPVGDHTSHPELQDALGLVAMAFNRRIGKLRHYVSNAPSRLDGARLAVRNARD